MRSPAATMSCAILAMRASCSASATSEISGKRPSDDGVVQGAGAWRMPSVSSHPAASSNDSRAASDTVRRRQLRAAWPDAETAAESPAGNHSRRELAQAPGGRHHVTLEVVAPAAQLVQHQRVASPMGHQPRFVALTAILKQLDRLVTGTIDFSIACSSARRSRASALRARADHRRERRASAHDAGVAANRRCRVLDR